ncbi:MAG: DinB family protein [Armatimonadetes bacterium]|nr:DinB family protein [Armatimonadota bacterium]
MASLKEHMAKRIEEARDSYIKDFEALDECELGRSLGGVARVPYDFTYEVLFVNKRIATRLSGGDPGPFSMEGWMKAPEEYRDSKRMMEEFRSTADEILRLWNGTPDGELEKEIPLPSGNTTSPLDLAELCASHMMYHDAQLNYIQTLVGDAEMHWD